MSKRLKPCEKCKGCGKLSSKDGKPWVEITTPTPNAEVRSGDVVPVDCDKCKGAGTVETEAEGAPSATKLAPVADGLSTSTTAAVTNVATKHDQK